MVHVRSLVPLVFGVLIVATLSGCLQSSSTPPLETGGDEKINRHLVPVEARANLPYQIGGTYSFTLENGTYDILPPLDITVAVDVPVGNGLPTQNFHMGIFLPDVPEGTKVPVIADVGPYYGDGDVDATSPANRLGGFMINNFVPHGYAVAQVSVFGTGRSGGCMDLMGPVEQAGIHAAVEYLGTQEWSNGNVGLIGRSYDGSTPWEAAMVETPHLKTIVPISGLHGVHDLMWRNGSAELRAPGVLWALYQTFSFTGEEDNLPFQLQQGAENAICPNALTGLQQGLAAYATGDYVAPEANSYWTERRFKDRALENYEGSVYLIHGMQDWNVDPHMAFPLFQEVRDAGIEAKGLFGQWQHNYPDRPNEHDHLRWDWAQDLLEWFDYYLKETGPKPSLHVEMQDDQGDWRIEQTYPPTDAQWLEWELGGHLQQTSEGEPLVSALHTATFESSPLPTETRIAGLPLFHVTVTPAGPGGQLYAELRDLDDGGRRVGHAIMDLRFAAGGAEAQPVVPGMPLLVKMEFEPFDTVIPAGHTLQLFVSNTGRDYLPSAVSNPVLIEVGSSSVLKLPTIERGPDVFFSPPGEASDDAVVVQG